MASKRRLRRNACTGKIVHTEGAAKARARRLWASGKLFIRAYKCAFGSHWHVGHYGPG